MKTPVMSTALPSLVDDEEDDLTPLPQGIQSHSQSGSSRMSPRPPLTRISSSDKLQNLRPYEKSSSRGRHTSEDRSLVAKNFVSGRKSESQEHIEGPGGSQHIVFRLGYDPVVSLPTMFCVILSFTVPLKSAWKYPQLFFYLFMPSDIFGFPAI